MAVQERVQEPRVQEAHGVTERVRRLREESLNTQPRGRCRCRNCAH